MAVDLCNAGKHPLNEDNAARRADTGRITCRACKRERDRIWAQKRREGQKTNTMQLPPRPRAPRWWEDANCAGMDPEIFFSDVPADQKEAKQTCDACPVTSDCLLAHLMDPCGYVGGTTPDDRRRMRQKGGYRLMVAADLRRQPAMSQETQNKIIDMHKQGHGYRAIARETGVHQSSVRRVVIRHKGEQSDD